MLAFYIAAFYSSENRDQNASILFHLFKFCTYFMCLFGGFLADSWIGKYKTLLILSFVNGAGMLCLVFSTLPSSGYSKL